jgi:hypothetical protein
MLKKQRNHWFALENRDYFGLLKDRTVHCQVIDEIVYQLPCEILKKQALRVILWLLFHAKDRQYFARQL